MAPYGTGPYGSGPFGSGGGGGGGSGPPPIPPVLGWGGNPWGVGPWGGSLLGQPTFLNLGFEIAGADAGTALYWTVTSSDPSGLYADWGPDPRDSEEGFERWSTYLPRLADLVTQVARFIIERDGAAPHTLTQNRESMDTGWPGTDSFQATVLSSEDALWGADGQMQDGFENSWQIFGGAEQPFVSALEDISTEANTPEPFEVGWSNEEFFSVLGGAGSPGSEEATFSGETFEDFEPVFFSVVGVVTSATANTISSPGHGFTSMLRVTVRMGLGTPPGIIVNGGSYYVLPVDDDHFKLTENTLGDPVPLVIPSVGTATLTFEPDGTAYWFTRLQQ